MNESEYGPDCTWNYRVMRSVVGDEDVFELSEVHYQGEKIIAWVGAPIAPGGETLDELRQDLELMTTALTLPALERAELEAMVL